MNKDYLYTARWELLNNVDTSPTSKDSLLALLDAQLGSRPTQAKDPISEIPGVILEPQSELPLGDLMDYDIDEDGDVDRDDFSAYKAMRKWCPQAEDLPNQKSIGQYQTKNNLPKGAIVHFTAGHPDQTLEHMGRIAKDTGFGYWCIDGEGRVGQANALDRASSHAGKSYYKGVGRSVSRYLVGIEVACPGKVKRIGGGKVKSWFPREFNESDCREVKAGDNRKAGLYYSYTEKQEDSLVWALMWMKFNDPDNFDFDLVLGHDEVSPDRKNDPGGSLSSTMPALRERLKRDYVELLNHLGISQS